MGGGSFGGWVLEMEGGSPFSGGGGAVWVRAREGQLGVLSKCSCKACSMRFSHCLSVRLYYIQTPVACVFCLVVCCSGQAQGRQHLHHPRQPHIQREPGEARALQHPTPPASLSHIVLLLLFVDDNAKRFSVNTPCLF